MIGRIEYSSLFTVAQAASTPQSLRQSLNSSRASSLLQRRHKPLWERACPRWPQVRRSHPTRSRFQRRHKPLWERACPRWPHVHRSHPASSRLQKRHKTLWERACPRWPHVRRSHPASSRFQGRPKPLWERACPRWPHVHRSHPASSRLQKRNTPTAHSTRPVYRSRYYRRGAENGFNGKCYRWSNSPGWPGSRARNSARDGRAGRRRFCRCGITARRARNPAIWLRPWWRCTRR